MNVELLSGRERKWCGVLGKEKVGVECKNRCKWSKTLLSIFLEEMIFK